MNNEGRKPGIMNTEDTGASKKRSGRVSHVDSGMFSMNNEGRKPGIMNTEDTGASKKRSGRVSHVDMRKPKFIKILLKYHFPYYEKISTID